MNAGALITRVEARHREGNPTRDTSTILVARAGHGEAVVNVDGPDL